MGSGSGACGRSRRGEDLGGVDDGGVPVGVHDLVDLVVVGDDEGSKGRREGREGDSEEAGIWGRVPVRPLVSAAHSAALRDEEGEQEESGCTCQCG